MLLDPAQRPDLSLAAPSRSAAILLLPELPPEPIGPSRMPPPTPGLPETPGADESSPPQAPAKQMEAATRAGKGFRIDPPVSRQARGKAGKNFEPVSGFRIEVEVLVVVAANGAGARVHAVLEIVYTIATRTGA